MTQKTATPQSAAKGVKTTGAKTTGAKTVPPIAPGYDWQDPLELEAELTPDERMVQSTARGTAALDLS